MLLLQAEEAPKPVRLLWAGSSSIYYHIQPKVCAQSLPKFGETPAVSELVGKRGTGVHAYLRRDFTAPHIGETIDKLGEAISVRPEVARYVEGFADVLTKDHEGKPHDRPSWNDPDYRGYLLGTMRDMFESYPLDGLQYGAERPTPLTDVLFKGTGFICFCEFCRSRGKAERINVDRVRDGGRALCEFMRTLRKGNAHTPDGVLPEFLAILF